MNRICCFLLFCFTCCVYAQEIVWDSEKIIDQPLVLTKTNLKIGKNARIVFTGKGALRLESGSFTAEDAEFTGEGTLKNDFRISLISSKVSIKNCRFIGLCSEEPMRFVYGAILIRFPGEIVFQDNSFSKCSGVAFVNCKKTAVVNNTFKDSAAGICFFHTFESSIGKNTFHSVRTAISLNASSLNIVENNRFINSETGVNILWECNKNIYSGNSFFDNAIGFKIWAPGNDNRFSGNLFDKTRSAFECIAGMKSGNVFANNVICKADFGFSFLKANREDEISLRSNAIVDSERGVVVSGGNVNISHCLFWKVKKEFILDKDSIVRKDKIIYADPLFKNMKESDYRPAEGSPLLKAGCPEGTNIGIFQ